MKVIRVIVLQLFYLATYFYAKRVMEMDTAEFWLSAIGIGCLLGMLNYWLLNNEPKGNAR